MIDPDGPYLKVMARKYGDIERETVVVVWGLQIVIRHQTL
jgi:hypothetical protein